MKQLTEFKEVLGKEISKVYHDGHKLWIRFKDDSFIVIEAVDITKGFGYTEYKVGIDNWTKDNTELGLLELKLITKKQFQEALVEEEKERERLYKEQEELTKKQAIRDRRRLYESLKKEFE